MHLCILKDPSGTTRRTSVPSGQLGSRIALRWVTLSQKPTLYLTGRHTAYDWSLRLACSLLGLPAATVEEMVQSRGDSRRTVLDALMTVQCTGSFGRLSPSSLDDELNAYQELSDCNPWGVVLDGPPAEAKSRRQMLDLVDSVAQSYLIID